MFPLFWLSLISACQSVLSLAPVATTTFTATAQPIVVTAPATQTLPTPVAVKKSEVLSMTQSSIVSKGIIPKRGNAKVSLPKQPGEYLLYSPKGIVQYISPDGAIKGNLIDGPLINEDGTYLVGMLSGQGTPRFIFMKTQGTQFQNPVFKSASIWMTDVFGNPSARLCSFEP